MIENNEKMIRDEKIWRAGVVYEFSPGSNGIAINVYEHYDDAYN